MRHILLLLSCLTIFAGACNERLENPDAQDANNTLVLSSSKSSLNSGQTTRLYARVPLKAGILDVAFSTSAGAFIENSPKATTINDLSDSLAGGYRWAAVTVLADATKGAVYLNATAKGTRSRLILTFNP